MVHIFLNSQFLNYSCYNLLMLCTFSSFMVDYKSIRSIQYTLNGCHVDMSGLLIFIIVWLANFNCGF